MPTTMRATATIARGEVHTDVAVPPGTTVAGLLAMVQIDVTDPEIEISLSDGSPVDLAAVIGGDLPAGVLLAVTQETESRLAQQRILAARETNWFEITATAAAILFSCLAAALLLGAAWLPVELSLPLRIVAGAAAVGGAVLLAAQRPFANSPAGALVIPLLAGSAAAIPLEPGSPLADSLLLTVTTAAAAIVGFGLWLLRPLATTAASAAVWGSIAILAGIAAAFGAGSELLGPLYLAGGVVLVLTAPQHALRVPETQLLDMPLLTTAAPSLRAPELGPPSRVTRRRVARTIAWGESLTRTLTLAGVGLAVAAFPPVAMRAGWQTLTDQAALACALASILSLALLPRNQQSRLLREAPRIAAAAQLGILCICLGVRGLLAPEILAVGLVLLAVSVASASVPITSEPKSALVSRLGDILQGFALFVLIPAAFLAAGLFELVREIAS